MFKKKQSTLRFCQTAYELPIWDLYGTRMTVAVSSASRDQSTSGRFDDCPTALGLLHYLNIRRDGTHRPSLPCEMHFVDRNEFETNEYPITGEILRSTHVDEEFPDDSWGYLRLQIIVRVELERTFIPLQRALLHAAASSRQFVHVNFVRPDLGRSPPENDGRFRYDFNAAKTDNDYHRKLAASFEDAGSQLPILEFESLHFRDIITTNAPSWTHGWRDSENLNAPEFQDTKIKRSSQVRRNVGSA